MFESNPYPRFILNCMSAYVMRCNYLSFYLRWEREKYKRLHNAINSFSISCLVSAFQPLSRRKKVNVMVFYIILWHERYLKAVDRTNDFKPFSNFLWPIQLNTIFFLNVISFYTKFYLLIFISKRLSCPQEVSNHVILFGP